MVSGRLVTNTGPLIALASIDRLDILRTLAEEADEIFHHDR